MKSRDRKADLQKLSEMVAEQISCLLEQKRPFGSSDVEGDVLHCIGMSRDDDKTDEEIDAMDKYAGELLDEMPAWFKKRIGAK